ncbi:MAG TPA: hypothetical protein VKT78_13540 [Fimbriimonadaceae bacterium]|nr:hypothetical protein [Fimbriimonadaceae bacterium]
MSSPEASAQEKGVGRALDLAVFILLALVVLALTLILPPLSLTTGAVYGGF